jgi:hypothetical protein
MVARAIVAGCVLLVGVCGSGPLTHAAEQQKRTWFERVERDRDRGAGRAEDQQSWELRRMKQDRTGRSFDRVDADRDRQLQLEALARQGQRAPVGKGPDDGSVILSHPPGAAGIMISPMAAQAAADERALARARDRLDRSLRAVGAAEQRALRSLKRRLNREGRAGEFEAQSEPVRLRYERLRTGHNADFQRVRARIVGTPQRLPDGATAPGLR